ncbi:hypothetical protein FisN_18Lh073 [Fistulifera solaris]|uniref:Uncharacterized protein n=1 Tax=Fistulifera solaris TaxID=1519565 RepID=A0A1Z5KE41_FISSO|nr:hypothetical protein FisN_18Lh073 [Fistulifera solaris]|eukprot:GAX24519.1 hypothetical protein FisN_18Lh073 [Fistulifera solaris]
MKFIVYFFVTTASAFTPSIPSRPLTRLYLKGADMSGNSWKPDSEKMGSTDTGDYFPEGYNPDIAFTDGWQGSQASLAGNNKRSGPAIPGLENLGADATMYGGITQASEIPPGMDFTPPSIPDGVFEMNVQAVAGTAKELSVNPVCMGFEDYYAAFSPGSHPSFSVSPAVGRMDRRGGAPTVLKILCAPQGQTGLLEGNLVINLPDDGTKIYYQVKANAV